MEEQNMETTEVKTFTQDEVNAIVSDRLKRANEKYADYEALKEKASKLDELEEAQKSELQKANEKAQALETELEQMKSANALREIKDKVSSETGVPVNLLTANNEEALFEQAKGILEYAKPQGYPQVKDGGEVHQVGKHSTRDQFAEWAQMAFSR